MGGLCELESTEKQNIEPEISPPVSNTTILSFMVDPSEGKKKNPSRSMSRKKKGALKARIRGAGNRISVSSSANVLQAAKAAALFPS